MYLLLHLFNLGKQVFLAQPLTFLPTQFQAREQVTMPPPGDARAARLEVQLQDPIWDLGYAPITAAVIAVSTRFNVLQYLTIRRYLSLVFGALVLLLLGMVLWR